VQAGKLREDLFYRLNVFAFRLPPLRERKDDLPLLVQAFISEFNAHNQRSISGVSPQVMHVFERYDWPGNVRELRNVIERATIVAQGPIVDVQDLPPLAEGTLAAAPASSPAGASRAGLSAGTTVEEAERKLIELTLEHTGGNKTRAADMLGISLKTLHNKLNRLNLRQKV
jgi:DNA-binding NtrC family response regulator